MPAKNALKVYAENSYYHIYNRGVNKANIFHGKQDYGVFLSYLKTYLLPKNQNELREQLANPNLDHKEKDRILQLLRLNNFANEVKLMAYCLMPNHFHFMIKQNSSDSIDRFMSSFATRYTAYINRKYKRVGPLYQGVYKAVLVKSDEQLLYLTAYIHRNPIKRNLASKGESFRAAILKQPSSYLDYIGERQTQWVHPEDVLSHFSKKHPHLSYQSFVGQTNDYSSIEKVTIDL